ncbi:MULTISPECIES: flagellar assembly protein FlbE [Brevundimonas]|uniref:flagellar assembly protein FlbE n=1 Tax=Brevundimonas TaxID=41275 RepID=UPI0013CEBFA3|nr:flagellar assembly protein FlbE [Brevundimonas lutea]
MTLSPEKARPFAFDTEFDATGRVVASGAPIRPVKRTYLAAEVDALVAQARAEARAEALAEAESMRSMALGEIGRAACEAAATLTAVALAHRADSAALAMAAARTMAGGALERCPEAPLSTAIEALAQEIGGAPRLVIRTAGLDEDARSQIEAACDQAGVGGQVVFRDEPGMATAAFILEWPDGRAEFDPEAVAGRVNEALAAALAAENGHGEPLKRTD